MYASANAAMKRAILDTDEEQRWTSAGTPPSSTIRRALLWLKARFQRAPAAVSWTSWKQKHKLRSNEMPPGQKLDYTLAARAGLWMLTSASERASAIRGATPPSCPMAMLTKTKYK